MIGQLTPHFTRAEFACRCGCGFDAVDEALVAGLEQLRVTLGKAIEVLSGCRCVAHNRAVGGEPDSQHVQGKAADIRVQGIPPRLLYGEASKIPPLRGFGIDEERSFLHVDTRLVAARWTYRKGKQAPWVAV